MGESPVSRQTVQIDECAGALIRAASRAEEDLAPLLPARKRAYLFTCLGFAAARTIMWLLPEVQVRPLPSLLFVRTHLPSNQLMCHLRSSRSSQQSSLSEQG